MEHCKMHKTGFFRFSLLESEKVAARHLFWLISLPYLLEFARISREIGGKLTNHFARQHPLPSTTVPTLLSRLKLLHTSTPPYEECLSRFPASLKPLLQPLYYIFLIRASFIYLTFSLYTELLRRGMRGEMLESDVAWEVEAIVMEAARALAHFLNDAKEQKATGLGVFHGVALLTPYLQTAIDVLVRAPVNS
ncbi:hypothetical protein BT69DRAFT_511586 [Atractiella rhizophila]|nr:hypothetical protein BT69DRAFT_511586 [Atractiella rhizophila]